MSVVFLPTKRSYPYTLRTPLGELGIGVAETHYSQLVTIKRLPYDVAPYSGKWNFHFGKGYTVDMAYGCFTTELEKTRDAKSVALSVAQWHPA